MSLRRQVLVHAHLFKNAGTTLDFSLKRSFGEGFCDHRDDDGMKRGATYLAPWLRRHPQIKALSSHWVTPPLPRSPFFLCHCLVMLRDPIERALSVYQFERRQQGVDTPGSRRAKELDFSGYMAWQLQPMPGPVVKDYQTRICSGDYLGNNPQLRMRQALGWLQALPVVGLVGHYDESMVLFEQALRPRFPTLDLSYLPQNITPRQPGPVTIDKRAAALDELGELAASVLAANQQDAVLLEWAQQRFWRQWAQLPEREARLAELRVRNARLAAAA